MAIVKYYEKHGHFGKVFNMDQALNDGWGINFEDGWREKVIGSQFVDRKKTSYIVTITRIELEDNFYMIFFNKGGWLLLDHAIEQFKPLLPLQ